MNREFINKVVLITGSKEGIGFQTALQLASRKWTILMADKQDLQAAKELIVKQTSNTRIFTYNLDLGSFKSIHKVANDIKNTQNRLDVLINNAGIFQTNEQKTVDNLNPVLQVNHFGPFLLTVLLTDLLKKTSPSRIIFVASSGAFLHTLDHQNLPTVEKEHFFSNIIPAASTLTYYYNSKLCNMIVSKEFGKRLKRQNITSNCLHPGMTSSSFLIKNSRYLNYLSPFAHTLIRLITQDPEQSANMVNFLATSKSVSQVTGQYFVNYQVSQTPRIVEDSEYCKKVWKQAERLVNLTEEDKLIFKC